MTTTAFALAGLGGFNAHGAGFLTAASTCKVVPDLVTATSGQIIVLADWFHGKNLEESLGDAPFGSGPLGQLALAMSGNPGVFRPAYQEALMRWWTPPKGSESLSEAMIDRLMPAQLFVSTRDETDFAGIADTLNNHAVVGGRPVGVIFNTYDLESGQAALFGNDAARAVWPIKKSIPSASRSNLARKDGTEPDNDSGDEPDLAPITAEAVRSALWLSLYGFERLPKPHLVDGAYHRSCIVAELHRFDRVFVARPLAPGWRGRPPRNWFEIQDWQIEMWFSVGYKAEVDALHKINGLVRQKLLGDPFRYVDLIEVAPHKPAGFFNYFIERKPVFKSAYRAAVETFERLSAAADEGKPSRSATGDHT